MASLAEILSALQALGYVDDGPATAPAASAPTVARAVSPFTASASGGTADLPPEIAAAIAPYRNGTRADRKAAIAHTMLAGWTCDVDTVDTNGQPTALHAYTYAHRSGTPCNGVSGIPKGETCPGKVR